MAITKKNLEAKIEEYLKLKAEADAAAKKADAIKAELKAIAAAEPSKTVTAGIHSVTITEAVRKSINVEEFKAAHPRLAVKFTKETPYSTVKIK
jgi:hypothetical protein